MDFLKSRLASAIATGPLAAYSVGDRIDVDSSLWTLNTATKRDTGAKCTIFTFDNVTNKSRVPIAQNAVRKSRTLHHPGVVKTIDTIDTETHTYIITEPLSPLSWLTRRQSITEETAKWGLWSIAKTVKFLNDDASSVHGCVRASSIFICETGEWKLGAFDLLSSMNDDQAVIYNYSGLVPDMNRYLPPEVSKTGWDTIKRNPLSATDAYGFGVLVTEVFSGSFNAGDINAMARVIPPSMQQSYKRLLNPNPKARLSVSNFLDQGRRYGGFFQTPLINLADGIEGLGLKDEEERKDFLDQLGEVGDDFPEEYMKRKVLPELLKSVEFGGGGPAVFSVVLKIGSKMTEEEYEAQLTPVLIRLFGSPDRAIRMCLLENLPLMIDHLSSKVVSDKIFPNLATGFSDTAPVIREQSVKSILIIITKLSDRTINGELLKYLAKTANDPEPGIRTNTTICLGKIAKHLGKNSRSKILVAAFTRSLRDPFVHARNAGVLALAATSDMFTEDDCATKVLPALCPSLLDKEKIVRDQANRAFEAYLTRIRQHAATMPETVQPPPGTTSGTATPQPRMASSSSDAASQAAGWAGWAISSFTASSKQASGTLHPTAPPITSLSNGRAPHVSVAKPTSQADRSSASANASVSASRQTSRSATPTAEESNVTAEAIAEDFDADAWGDMGDMNDDATSDSTFAANTSGSLQSSQAQAQGRFASTSKTSLSTATTTPDGEPDFAAWLAAKKTPAAKKELPKGLGAKKTLPSSGSGRESGSGAGNRPVVGRATTGPGSASSRRVEVKREEAEKNAEEEGWGDAWD